MIDLFKLMTLIDKKKEGHVVDNEQISSCISMTKFTDSNKRTELLNDTINLVNNYEKELFKEYLIKYSSLLN